MSTKKDRLYTKEELIELLKQYKKVLSSYSYDYLKSLIELDFSVIKNEIDSNDRLLLSKLELYEYIAIYNIYHRVLNLIKKELKELELTANSEWNNSLSIFAPLSQSKVKLFNFDFDISNKKNSSSNELIFGKIDLFQTIWSSEKRDQEMDRVLKKLESLYDSENPHGYKPHHFGGPAANWNHQKYQKIKEYENLFKKLDSKSVLTADDEKIIEFTNKYCELFLNDFGLTMDSFIDPSKDPFYFLSHQDQSEMQKKLVRDVAGIRISDNIKYL